MKHLKSVIISMALTFLMALNVSAATVKVININLTYDGKTVSYREKEVHVLVDGDELTNLDMPAVIISGRTLVPLRAIFEKMGADVSWNNSTQKITADFENGDIVTMYINNKAGIVNGNAFNMDVAPKIINDRTMVPVRAIAEAVGATVGWEDATRTVTINSYVLGAGSDSNTNTDNNDSNNSSDNDTSAPDTSDDSNKVTDLTHADLSEIDTSANTSSNEVRVTDVMRNGNDTYTIQTSGKIWQYKYATVLNSKVAVDIYGGTLAMGTTNIDINDDPVNKIRVAQNALQPYKIVRVVFDLGSAAGDYSVTKSADGKSIVVQFGSKQTTPIDPNEPVIGENPSNPEIPTTPDKEDELGNTLNAVNRVTLKDGGESDVLTIYADETPNYKIFTLNNPYRIVIDIENSAKAISSLPSADNSYCLKNVRMSQFTENSTRIVLDVEAGTEFSSSSGNGSFSVTLKKTSVNITESLINDGKSVIFTAADGLRASDITHSYDPYSGKTIVYLNGDYSSTYGTKTLTYSNPDPASSYISSAVFSTVNGKTRITLTPSLISEYNIYENDGYIHIDQADPRSKYDAVVVIDAGHGGGKPGAIVNGVYEKTITLDIAKRIYSLFEGSNIKVYVTRLTDTDVDNSKRAYMANVGADMFVSIHCNSIAGIPNIYGTETLYAPHSGEGNGQLTSYQLASVLQKNVTSVVGTNNRGVKNRSDLIVLNKTSVPAALVETGFMTDSNDMALINSASGRQKFAQAIYQAIKEVVNGYDYR